MGLRVKTSVPVPYILDCCYCRLLYRRISAKTHKPILECVGFKSKLRKRKDKIIPCMACKIQRAKWNAKNSSGKRSWK